MSELGPVVVRHTIDAPQETVWAMLSDASSRESWWPGSVIECELGGEITDANGTTGTVDVLVEGLTLGFRWRTAEDAMDRTVVVMLRPEDEDFDQTRVTVIESGFAALPNAAAAVQDATTGWNSIFGSLATLTAASSDDVVSEAAAPEGEPLEFIDSNAVDGTGELEETPDDVVIDAEEPDIDVTDGSLVDDDPVDDAADDVDVDVVDDIVEAVAEAEEAIIIDDSATDDMSNEEVAEVSLGQSFGDLLTGENSIIEIIEDDVVDAEAYDPAHAIMLPEVGDSPYSDSALQVTADLGVNESVEVDETSEWERLLRGDDIDQR